MRLFDIRLCALTVALLSLWGCGRNSSVETVDVFYLVSTDIVSAEDSEGNVSYRATLTSQDSLAMKGEMDYVRKNMFRKPFNFVSPYYHQFTFDAISLPKEKFDSVYNEVVLEVCGIFDDYIRNKNGGRHFILAGFSQGAMLVQELLKHMDDETFGRMDAAYAIGYKVTEEDLADPHIKPARFESDRNALISFNTVLSRKGIWPFVAEGTVECMNPVNWKTDSTPGTFSFGGQDITVRIDPDTHVMVAEADAAPFHEWMQNTPVYGNAGVDDDCLHHWDLLFYCDFIYRNACLRSKVNPFEFRD